MYILKMNRVQLIKFDVGINHRILSIGSTQIAIKFGIDEKFDV